MNLQFSKKEIFILISGIVFALILYLIMTFSYLNPLKESVIQKEQQLKTEKQLQAAYEKRVFTVPSGEMKSVSELYKKIPNQPFTEELILNFEKAEVVSNSTIILMEFGERDSAEQQETADPEVESGEGSKKDSADGISKNLDKMPAGLNKTSVTLSVESNSYEGLEKFIQVLEESKREMSIDSIEFEGPEGIGYDAGEEELILFTVTLSAYYFPEMIDSNDNPMRIETPEPANKRNPFPTFGDHSEENVTETNSSINEEDGEGSDEP